ncbi:hypothetical protein CFP65_1141 [Kitasatospora sp. MMS16-BH015]|uniref:hypothetical protein n=1 Tax=Kitasatospora sp. MMS16-BH015 TaxID=2018025 RepID=UPI000CA316DF|nr:hypothetical protein [Kitasatospora sp. MMS16-BH015]AUG76051.1 hypothetical protein CFP65_1141 [Kitasatospora sp. MMS16-BH015]
MPSTELRHTYTVAAPPAAVLAHLATPENYIGLSPLLVAVRDIHQEAGTTHYTAVERFRFLGLIQHDNIIRVTLHTSSTDLPTTATVSGKVTSPGAVRMDYTFTITAQPGATSLVTDTLHLHTPFGLLRYAAGKAAAVQAERGRVLAHRLANAS